MAVTMAMMVAFGAKCTVVPDGEKDMTETVMEAVAQMKDGGEVELNEGTYHFYEESAKAMEFYISNHDQPMPRKVQLPLCGTKKLTMRGKGKGAKFIFHGVTTGILLMDAEGTRLENIDIDWVVPPIGEARIAGQREDGQVEMNWIVEGMDGTKGAWMLWDADTRAIKPGTGDVFEFAQACIGDVVSFRTWERPAPAICLYRAKDTQFKDVRVRAAHGMGLLAQRSENVSWQGGGTFPREGCYCSTKADATHFSNCKGKISVCGARFEGMMDDAINVHSTCLKIEETQEDGRIKCRYMHEQAIGFEVFAPGERLRFIRSRTLENGPETKVKAVERLDERTVVLTVEGTPEGYGAGDAVENADWQPEVEFCGNTVKNNRARAALFTTPGRVIVKDNLFDHVSGSAILFAGDASNWFESGACRDVEISGNTFRACLTSKYQFCNAVITVAPSVPDPAAQTTPYHRNIRVTDNRFEDTDEKLWDGVSVAEVEWRGNTLGMSEEP